MEKAFNIKLVTEIGRAALFLETLDSQLPEPREGGTGSPLKRARAHARILEFLEKEADNCADLNIKAQFESAQRRLGIIAAHSGADYKSPFTGKTWIRPAFQAR